MSEAHQFQPGETAVLLQPLRLSEASPKAEAGETVTVLFAWPTRDRQPGYRVRYRERGSLRELHVVLPATALAKLPSPHSGGSPYVGEAASSAA